MADLKFHNKVEVDSAKPQFDIPQSQIQVEDDTLPDESGTEKRGRGRPKGSKNKTTARGQPVIHYGTQRDHKEVSTRLSGILTGVTGIVASVRPHFAMTDKEATNISAPLSSWLIRQEEYSPKIKDFLDRYDLIAASIAMLTYLVRVWKEDNEYRKSGKLSGVNEVNTESDRPIVEFPREGPARESRFDSVSDGEQSEPPTDNAWVSAPLAPGR